MDLIVGPDGESRLAWLEDTFAGQKIRFAICQLEIAPATGTPHLQGTVMFLNMHTLMQVVNIIHRSHIEVCRSVSASIAYCEDPKKRAPGGGTGPFHLGGRPKGPGNRSDLEQCKALLDSGKTVFDCCADHFGTVMRYRNSLTWYMLQLIPPRNSPTKGILFWGPTGGGKTKRAYAEAQERGAVHFINPPKRGSGVWYDGYINQATVIYEEFTGYMPFGLLLSVLDRYPLKLQFKSGFIQFVATLCYFTTNLSPGELYVNMDTRPLFRRWSDPLGRIEYIGNSEFPSAELYIASRAGLGKPAGLVASGEAAVPIFNPCPGTI